jgi:hypothetical protein
VSFVVSYSRKNSTWARKWREAFPTDIGLFDIDKEDRREGRFVGG